MTAKKTEIFKKKRKVAIGSMRDQVKVMTRSITAPLDGEVDFGVDFVEPPWSWANIWTVEGITEFDGVALDDVIDHVIRTRYINDITDDSWIELRDGRRLHIEKHENLEERNEFSVFFCTTRGSKDQAATSR